MLVNTSLRQAEAQQFFDSIRYDKRYMYYSGGAFQLCRFNFDSDNSHYLTSVDEKTDQAHGFISYFTDMSVNKIYGLGLCAVIFNSRIFVNDTLELINRIFMEYNFNKIEWYCYRDNPAIKLYEHFIKIAKAKKVGIMRDSSKLSDGKYHDDVFFELMRKDYLKSDLFKRLNCKE